MEPTNVQRKLAAILSADVKGYSRLMQADEVGTVRTLTAYRELMATLIREHRGRVVDATGEECGAKHREMDMRFWLEQAETALRA